MKNKNILILGGQGFIGQNLCLKLLENGYIPIVFEKYINEEKKLQGCKYIAGDFHNIENYDEIFEDISTVYHLISTTTPNSDRYKIEFDITSNLISTTKMLNVCVEKKVQKVIFASSGGTVYGIPQTLPIKETHTTNPICAYGINKLAIEKYLQMYHKLYNLDYTILRISNPYGDYHSKMSQGAINVFVDKIKNNQPIEIWGDGSVVRDYIHIDDVVEAFLQALNPMDKKIFNIASGVPTSLNQIIEILSNISQKKPEVNYTNTRAIDIPECYLDNSLAQKILKWAPTITLEEGIARLF